MSNFIFADYIPLALRTEAPLPTAYDRMNHALLGLISETGEFTTEIKRIAIYGKSLDDAAKTGGTLRLHIAEEIGDTLWYVAIAADALKDAGLLAFKAEVVDFDEPTSADLIDVVKSLSVTIGEFSGYLIDEPSLAQGQDACASAVAGILHDLNILAGMIHIPLSQIADENIAKLTLRYPDKFSAEAAEARADKGGADARNS